MNAATTAPAAAAPYIRCDQAKYAANDYKVTVKCHAASPGQVRIAYHCFNIIVAPIPVGTRYGAWKSIAAGTSKTLTYYPKGWCSGWNQTTRADGEIR